MKKILIVYGILCFFLTGCQQEEVTEQEEQYPVQLNIAFNNRINNSTEYTPMTRAGYTDAVEISNCYRYIIAEKISNNWIVVEEGLNQFRDDIPGTDNFKANSIDTYTGTITTLRPGYYCIFFFNSSEKTGGSTANWTNPYNVGDIIPDQGTSNLKQVLEYGTWNNAPSLAQEVFYARKEFIVTKKTSLKNTSPVNKVEVTLQRRVAKFRILLDNNGATKFDDINPLNTLNPVFDFSFERTDGEDFASGLDIWGDLYYDSSTPFNKKRMYIECNRTTTELNDGGFYLANNKVQYYTPYIFCDESDIFDVRFADTQISGYKKPYKIRYTVSTNLYENPVGFVENGLDNVKFEIKNNTITGIVLQYENATPVDSDYKDKERQVTLEPIRTGPWSLLDPVDLIGDGNFEYKD